MNDEKKTLIKVTDLKQYFPIGKKKVGKPQAYVKANDGISLNIYEGETLGLVGESGCGKSTFGRTILQLYPQTGGSTIYYGCTGEDYDFPEAARQDNGINLAKLPGDKMRYLRRDLQLIFQDPYSSLNPRMTVGQIIGEGLVAHGMFKKGDPKMQDYIMEVMEKCGLSSYFIHRYPHQFSGGQRQRIGIARSLAVNPKFVVCDEAVSALDVSIQSQIINLLLDLKEQNHLTYLFISHDLSVIKYISDRIGVMYLGSIMELSDTEHLFAHPYHPYTEALLSAIPTTDANTKKESIILEGDIPSPVNPPKGCKFHTRCRYCTKVCEQEVPKLEEVAPGHFVACHHKLGVQE